MKTVGEGRRSFLLKSGGFAAAEMLLNAASADAAVGDGYVLDAEGGEHLVHFRDKGEIVIKAGASTGSANLAVGTQQVKTGTGIPVHRHFRMDETFLVMQGSGVCMLNDVRYSFAPGGSVFIPRNTWHGFENPDQELLLLWIVSPAGLDGFFRATCTPPGVAPKQLTREQINKIAQEFATEFR